MGIVFFCLFVYLFRSHMEFSHLRRLYHSTDPCDYISCEEPEVCRLDYERRARCVCSEFCGEDFIPVCGSDGRTYTNECFLRRQACRMMPSLRIVFHGQCDQGK